MHKSTKKSPSVVKVTPDGKLPWDNSIPEAMKAEPSELAQKPLAAYPKPETVDGVSID